MLIVIFLMFPLAIMSQIESSKNKAKDGNTLKSHELGTKISPSHMNSKDDKEETEQMMMRLRIGKVLRIMIQILKEISMKKSAKSPINLCQPKGTFMFKEELMAFFGL